MPNIKSAEKRVRVTGKKTARNNRLKSNLKTELKKFDASLVNAEADSNAAFVKVSKSLDKAVTKGIIHKNAASRKKARLYKRLQANDQPAE